MQNYTAVRYGAQCDVTKQACEGDNTACIRGICQCAENHKMDSTTNKCTPSMNRSPLGGDCYDAIMCVDESTGGMTCRGNKCTCAEGNGQYANGTRCQKRT